MAIDLVTGHAGTDHVSSASAGRYNAGVCGLEKYVLETGQQFAATIESANVIRIASGDAINQGRHITIPQNTYEDADILTGTQGKTRIDVIALRYTKTTQEVGGEVISVESASIAVIKGAEVASGSTPVAPAINDGDIFNGDVIDDMALYHVLITDLSISSVTPVFATLKNIGTVNQMIGSENMGTAAPTVTGAIKELVNKIGNTAMGATSSTITGAINEIIAKIGSTAMGTTATTVTAAIKDLYDKVEVLYEDDLTMRLGLDRDNVTINAGQSYVWFNAHVPVAGYRAKGIAGTRLFDAVGGGNYLNCGFSFCEVYWNAELQTDDLDFAIRNHGSSVAKIRYHIEVLYQKVR